MKFDPATTAVLIVDLQNDFLDPKGAYGRAGQTSPEIAALPDRILPPLDAVAGGWVVFNIYFVPGKAGSHSFITFKKPRPLLTKGDFAPASWGIFIEMLQPADIVVEKVAYSAFYQTRMEFALSRAGINTVDVRGS